MGNFLKNTRLISAGTSVQIPVGTTANRPTTALPGQLRFNTDTGRFEFYQSGWKDVASRGALPVVKDIFTGDGSTTDFTMSVTPINGETGIQVFLGNVHQNPSTAYTVSTSTLSFLETPPSGQTIEVYHGFDSTDR